MEFREFMVEFTKHSEKIFTSSENLFLVNISKDKLWETYIESFPPDKNKLFRTKREYECSCCKSFVRQFGNVVSVVDNKIVSFWDFSTNDDTFQPVLEAMSSLIKNASIEDGFITKERSFGADVTREILENQTVHSWNHFYIKIPKTFVEDSSRLSVPEIKSIHKSVRDVFKRSLDEISKDSVQSVLDMIDEGQLYRGEEWKPVLEKFQSLQKTYSKIKNAKEKDNFSWVEGFRVGGAVGKIRNHSIGTLLVDISNGVDIEEAVRRYEHIVAPQNYKRPKPIFTAKMIDEAKKTLVELGLENSLSRRHAKISDITINNVLWANRSAKKSMKNGLDAFESLKEDNEVVSPRKFENLKGIPVEKFMEQMKSMKVIELLFENRHEGNLVSLIAPEDKEAPSLFKWNNSFSWSYNGNISDSMKQRVKTAGGNVEGVLRFSLQWNDGEYNPNDFDAHCVEPNGDHIYFSTKGQRHRSTGILDVDIINPQKQNVAVENISWSDFNKMPNGVYKMYVHNYSHRGGRSGFSAEVEFNGEIHEFSYNKELKAQENIQVAEVNKTNSGFTMVKSLPSSVSQRQVWNLKTNQFVPVSTIMFSPNHWDDNGVGNKHYFFMINGCLNETSPNGFYNEYLKEDFTKHRKVFEALGGKMKVENSDTQLSGVGFSSTKRDYIIVKADEKIIKVII